METVEKPFPEDLLAPFLTEYSVRLPPRPTRAGSMPHHSSSRNNSCFGYDERNSLRVSALWNCERLRRLRMRSWQAVVAPGRRGCKPDMDNRSPAFELVMSGTME